MSWFSAAFTRAKGAIGAAVSVIPVVGGVAAHAITSIHTGDEHKDPATGQWVLNSQSAGMIPQGNDLAGRIVQAAATLAPQPTYPVQQPNRRRKLAALSERWRNRPLCYSGG
jgi:hypothetical protein